MIIKKDPKDFFVEELPLRKPGQDGWDDDGDFAIFRLTKINMNCEHAIDIISKRFHIQRSEIKYAGTKDKNAHTIQYISIPKRQGISGIDIDEENLRLEHVGFSSEPLSLGSLKGNRFIITLRDLTPDEKQHAKNLLKEMDFKELKSPMKMPNYFDEQRFSTYNYGIGLAILKKDYTSALMYMTRSSKAYADRASEYLSRHPNDNIGAIKQVPKKNLLMYIHSVQSYIFNEALSKILLENALKRTETFYLVPYSIGRFVFYGKGYDDSIVPMRLELAGFDTSSMHHEIKRVMDDLGLVQRDFIIRALPDLSAQGDKRDVFVDISNLEMKVLDDRIILEFELQKGSYATIAIKSLFSKVAASANFNPETEE